MKNKKFYLLSFFVPLICMLVLFLIKGFITGEYSVLYSDMWHQYYRIFVRLKEILIGEGSLFYTFKIGFGQSFLSTLAYYAASPLNLVTLLFNNIQTAIKFLVILKISLCGLFMFTYLKYHFKNENSKLLIFSTAYALSQQIICNYFNIMWLDAYYLAPLILLGIDKLIDEDKSILYFITLFLTISTNYYMGYISCIFSVLYFIYKIILKHNKKELKEVKIKTIKFLIVSILAGMSSMLINIPNLLGMSAIDRTTIEYVGNTNVNTNILLNLSKLFPFNHTFEHSLNKDYVYWYSGIIIIPLIILYFKNKQILKKEKIVTASFLSILLLSVLITPINNIWHAFNYAIGFNYRYFYLFLIIILYISCKSFINSKDYTIKDYLIINLVFTILGIILLITNNITLLSLIISIILLVIYCTLIYLYNNKEKLKDIIKIIIPVLVILELFLNASYMFNLKYFYKGEYIDYVSYFKQESLKKINEYDNGFKRIEFLTTSYNDSMLYDYNSLSGWYSTLNGQTVNFLSGLGYYASINLFKHNEFMPLDSLFGLNYYVTSGENKYYNKIGNTGLNDETGSYINNIYKNPYALSIGYMINTPQEKLICENPYDCQNKFIKELTGEEINYYIKGNLEKINETSYKFKIEEDKNFVIAIIYGDLSEKPSYGINVENYDGSNKAIPLTLSSTYKIIGGDVFKFDSDCKKESEYIFKLTDIVGNISISDIYLYYEDEENINEIYDNLSKNQLNLEEIKDGYIKGNIEVNNLKNTLFLSIPYENGWKVKVDGKESNIISIYNTFIGIELEDGIHEIELSYEAPGIKLGIIVSVISISIYGIYLYYEKKRNK